MNKLLQVVLMKQDKVVVVSLVTDLRTRDPERNGKPEGADAKQGDTKKKPKKTILCKKKLKHNLILRSVPHYQ
jgi:hypothetical protein